MRQHTFTFLAQTDSSTYCRRPVHPHYAVIRATAQVIAGVVRKIISAPAGSRQEWVRKYREAVAGRVHSLDRKPTMIGTWEVCMNPDCQWAHKVGEGKLGKVKMNGEGLA